MLTNLLSSPLFTGSYTFVLGMLIIFLGIAIIVIFVSLAGKVFSVSKNNKKPIKKIEEKQVENNKIANSNEISDEIKAVIVACISAYYFENKNSKCDFIVKKIKKI